MSNELKKSVMLINKNLDFIKKNYNIKNIGIFGSVVKNKQTKKSDVDVLVELQEPVGFFKFLELENYLSKILKRKVDLTTKKSLKQAVKKEILKDIIYV